MTAKAAYDHMNDTNQFVRIKSRPANVYFELCHNETVMELCHNRACAAEILNLHSKDEFLKKFKRIKTFESKRRH
jgi:hypothetical protein